MQGDGAMIDRTQSTGSSDFLCLSANGSYGNSFSRLQSSSSYVGSQGAMDYTQQQTTHTGIDYTQQHTTHQGAIDYTQQQQTTHEYGGRQEYTSQDQQHFQMPPQQQQHQTEQAVSWPGEAPAINGMEVHGPMDPDVNAPGWNEDLWFEQEVSIYLPPHPPPPSLSCAPCLCMGWLRLVGSWSRGGEAHCAEAAARHQAGPNEGGGDFGALIPGVYPSFG